MTNHDALLKGVLADPEDDIVRLVYADWLQENDQEPRAEFVRVQVELAKTPLFEDDYENCRACGGDGLSSPPPYHRTCRPCNGTGKKDHKAYTHVRDLLNREDRLWKRHAATWFSKSDLPPGSVVCLTDAAGGIEVGSQIHGPITGSTVFGVRRGFIDRVDIDSSKLFGGGGGVESAAELARRILNSDTSGPVVPATTGM